MGDTLANLLEQRVDLRAELGATRQEIRKEKKKSAAQAKAAAKHWELTGWQKNVAMVIYNMAEYQTAPVVKFLQQTARRRQWPVKAEEDLVRIIEDVLLESDAAEVVAMADLQDPQDPSVATEALKYIHEWRAVVHVQDMNERLGLAPSTENILQKLEANRLAIPEPLRPPCRGTAAEAAARNWAFRFRVRSGARYGKIRICDGISLAEMQEKAEPASTWIGVFLQFPSWNPGTLCSPDSGPNVVPRFRAQF